MAMTFEEYEEKHLHDLNHEARRLVRMGWNARASHGNPQGILDSSGHIADARKMVVSLKPIAESKVRQLGGDVCGVLVRKDGRLAAVDEHGRVQWLQDGQGAEPVGFVQGGGLEQLSKGHPAKIYPKNVTPSPLEPHTFVYTRPQPAQPAVEKLRCQQCGNMEPFHATGCETEYGNYAPTTPQDDGWVNLVEGLAKRAESENISVEVVFDDGYAREEFDTDISEHVANWLRSLKRPQPPKEGSGDEH